MAFGGSSEFLLLEGGGLSLPGPSYSTALSTGFGAGTRLWGRWSSDESTDFQAITGYFTGIGAPANPFSQQSASICGGSSSQLGMRPGDIVFHVETTAGARPGRVTLHSVLASTANFSTATYKSTGSWDVTLSNSCTQ